MGLGVVFVATLMVSLVLIKLNGTLLEPHYYPDLLKRNDLYRFVMVDVLTTALDEARSLDSGQLGGNFRQNPLVTSGLTARQMTEAVHRGLSPQDLEMLAEPAVLQIAEYATAERDRVMLTVDAGSHVKAVANEVHRLMLESGSYALFIEHELEPRVRQAAGDMLSADENVSAWTIHVFGSSEAAEDRMVWVVMSALTPDWMAGQIAKALDELMPYVLGESDSFEIRIQFTDAEIETAVGEIKSILLEADAYEIEYLDYVRSVMDQGWTYSHHDLRDGLSGRGDALQALDQIRSFFREGYSYAYQAQAGHRSNDPVGSAMDRTRARLAMVSRYELPAYLLTPLLLIVIGLLGGNELADSSYLGVLCRADFGSAGLCTLMAHTRAACERRGRTGARRSGNSARWPLRRHNAADRRQGWRGCQRCNGRHSQGRQAVQPVTCRCVRSRACDGCDLGPWGWVGGAPPAVVTVPCVRSRLWPKARFCNLRVHTSRSGVIRS